MQGDFEVGIGVLDDAEAFADFDVDTCFFFDFTGDSGLEGLAAFLFAAGELPQAAEQGILPAFVNQDPVAFTDNADNDCIVRQGGFLLFDRQLVLSFGFLCLTMVF